MKFAQKLRAVQGVYSQYVCYRTLKKFINEIEKQEHKGGYQKAEIHPSQLWSFDSTTKTSIASLSQSEIAFVKNLEHEIVRVKKLYSSKSSQLRDQLTDVFRRLHGGFALGLIQQDIDAIAKELVDLDRFIRQSKVMFYKILKKHDRRTSLKVGGWMIARLEQEPFWMPRFDDLLVGLSDAYSQVRKLHSKQLNKAPVSSDQDVEKFLRHTQKFFVRPEDTMWVKTCIVKHLPLDIFGRKAGDLEASLVDYSDYLESLHGLSDSSVINSIYLDNENLDMYHNRIGVEGPRGNLIRIRWYGDHVNPPSFVFMERKTRQGMAYDVDEAIKERFRIKNDNVQPYLQGKWSCRQKLEKMVLDGKIKKEKADELVTLSEDIQTEIVNKNLGPAVRTVCRRAAFQEGKDQTLRFSLDSNLHMIDETPAGRSNWFRDMDHPIDLKEVIKFPFAVLEVKTQVIPPDWVKQLQSSPFVIPAEHFSKFLYGTARLRSNIRFVPPWYEATLSLLQLPPSPALSSPSPREAAQTPPSLSDFDDIEEQEEKETQKKHSFGWLRSRSQSPDVEEAVPLLQPEQKVSVPEAKGVPQVKATVKPAGKGLGAKQQRTAKTFFANERTLLSWVNTVTFLSLTGLTLLNTNSQIGRVSGLAMISVTICFAVYALRKYRKRLAGLTQATMVNLEDRVGPIVLVVTFCLVLLFVACYFGLAPFFHLSA